MESLNKELNALYSKIKSGGIKKFLLILLKARTIIKLILVKLLRYTTA